MSQNTSVIADETLNNDRRSAMRWQKKLTKKELQHLHETGANTLEDVRANVLYQSKNQFPCWECVEIGRKLGISVELTAFNSLPKP